MSHSAPHGSHDPHPEPPPRAPKHGPGDCYGMSQKKFWKIVFVVAVLTAGIVGTIVILVST